MKVDGRGDFLRLADILLAIHKIRTYTKEGKESFLASPWLQDAVVRNLEIIGEAAGKVSPRVRGDHPSIEWTRMRGFASFAKHEYWKIDADRLWIIVEEIPSLERGIAAVRIDREKQNPG